MTTQAEWRSQLGFADRLKNIQAIIAAWQTAHPECDFQTSQLEATAIENQAVEDGNSREDYDNRCREAIDELREESTLLAQEQDCMQSVNGDLSFGDEGDNILIPPKRVGPYQKAYYHREGIFSIVYRARRRDGDLVALKVTSPGLMQPPHNSLREARVLESLRHDNIVKLNRSFREPGGQFVLEFPFLRHQIDELWRANQLTPSQIKSCLRGLFSALDYIHANGIIHRDVKPSNILLDSPEGPAYLTDFGIAWSPSDTASEPANEKITDVGTTAYRPPELLFGDQAYGPTLDMWAAGCVVAEASIATHEKLFDAGPLGSELGLIKSIFTTLGTPNENIWPSASKMPDWGKMQFQQYQPKSWKESLPAASEEARDLVGNLVCYEQTRRLTAAE
ncbi:hypothetical protein KEM54_002592, partial [Ascosphaera aggregata]